MYLGNSIDRAMWYWNHEFINPSQLQDWESESMGHLFDYLYAKLLTSLLPDVRSERIGRRQKMTDLKSDCIVVF